MRFFALLLASLFWPTSLETTPFSTQTTPSIFYETLAFATLAPLISSFSTQICGSPKLRMKCWWKYPTRFGRLHESQSWFPRFLVSVGPFLSFLWSSRFSRRRATSLRCRIQNRIPLTMNDLRKCKREKKCSESKPKLFTHVELAEPIENSTIRVVNGWRTWEMARWRRFIDTLAGRIATKSRIWWSNEMIRSPCTTKCLLIMGTTRLPLSRICGFMVGKESEWLVEYEFVLAGNLFAFDVPHSP